MNLCFSRSSCDYRIECAIKNGKLKMPQKLREGLIYYNFISDQEEVVKELIRNNSEILNTEVNGDSPIHFAVKHSES